MANHGEDAQAAHSASTPSERLTLLAQRALAGSTDDRFLNACWECGYAAARRLGRKHHGAEDSAQEAVVVVYRLLRLGPSELDPDSVGALVRLVVLRHVNQVARRRLLEARVTRELSAGLRDAPDAAREVETDEWARRVRAAVATLRQPLRRLIELRHWDGMSTRDIAREVRTSETSVRRLLAEAESAIKLELRRLAMDDDGGAASPRQAGRP